MNAIIFIVLFSILSNDAYCGSINSDTITSITKTINNQIQNVINSVNSFMNQTENTLSQSNIQLNSILERANKSSSDKLKSSANELQLAFLKLNATVQVAKALSTVAQKQANQGTEAAKKIAEDALTQAQVFVKQATDNFNNVFASINQMTP